MDCKSPALPILPFGSCGDCVVETWTRNQAIAAEMALHVLAYNLTRVMNIMGTGRLVAEIKT